MKTPAKVLKSVGFPGHRHYQCFLVFVAVTVGYGMRTNMSVGIIAMMSDKPPSADIPTYPHWTEKGLILSSFFWGYIVPQIGAGQLVKKFGPKWFLAGAMLVTSLFSLLIPVMAQRFDEGGVIACRVVQGLSQGFLFPSAHTLLGKWTPLAERSRIASFVYTGGPLGTVLSMPLTGVVSDTRFGWPGAFYLYGIVGIVWVVAWAAFGANSPSQHATITAAERDYIEASTGGDRPPMPTPWRAICTSLPMWAILVAHCGQNWGFWTLLTEIPTYMNKILGYAIEENSFLSALPYFALWLLNFLFSSFADYLTVTKNWTIGRVRKLLNSIGLLVPAVALVSLAFVDSGEKDTAIRLLVVAVGSNAAIYCGFNVNHIDLSPNHAGTLMGITNGISNIFSIIAPLILDAFGRDENDPILWRLVFCLAAAIYVVSNVFFVIFASGEVQPWNDDPDLGIVNKKINSDNDTNIKIITTKI